MRLWLLRHGEAEPRARSDAERPLTAAGREEVLSAAAHLLGRPLTTIIASTYLRAQQTAALVAEALGFAGGIITVPWLTPDDDPRAVVGQLDDFELGECLLVSHNPLLGHLAGLLLHGHLQSPLPLQTASLAGLDGDFIAAGLMRLGELHHPA